MNTMDFQELLDRYSQLREDLDAGNIDEEQFQDEIEGLQAKDEQGRYWTIGAQTGKWYRYDGRDWVQETPIPMTKHRGRGIPEAVSRQAAARQAAERPEMPRWLYAGCGGLVLLAVVAGVVIAASSLLQSRKATVSQKATPTLVSGIPANTPTPGPTPSLTLTIQPTPTQPTLKVYSNSAFGFSMQYPSDWQVKESSQQVVMAPSAEGLTTSATNKPSVNAIAFAVGSQPGGVAESASSALTRLISALPADPSSGDTGIRSVHGVDWVISQIELNASGPAGEMIAYAAATYYNGVSYTVLAAAPTAVWNALAPTFQQMFDSIQFTAPQAAVGSPVPVAGATPLPVAGSTPGVGPTEEATPGATPTPVTYVVQSGDTLGGIAIQFGVSVEDLQAANGIDDPAKLRVDQELIIPGDDFAPAGAGAVTATPTPGADMTPTLVIAMVPTSGTSSISATEAVTGSVTVTATVAAVEATSTPTPEAEPSGVVLSGKIVYPVFAADRMLQDQPGSYDIWMSDPQGNGREVLLFNASQPHLNVGGDLLAYRSWEPSQRGVAFTTIGGGRGGLLTNFVEDGLPSWDPSSITMVFSSRREGDRVPRLYRVNQASEDEYALGTIADYVSTLPDGRLVYKGCTVEGACGIYVGNTEGGGAVLINSSTSDTAPAPSPDGTRIAFMSREREGAGNYEIFVMSSGGENVTRLTNNGSNDGLPVWSPDGSAIAFASDRDGTWSMWAMNPDGSNQRKLFPMGGSPDGIVASEISVSRGWLEERISWSR